MLKPIDMPTMTQRSVDLVQTAQEQHMRAEIASQHAGRMDRQSVEQMTNGVTKTEKDEFSRISEKRESNSGGQGKEKKKDKTEQEPETSETKGTKLPDVGYAPERVLDIRI